MAWFLAVAAAVLAVVGLSLATDGPTVQTASDGDYHCYAPYDIVLNDQDPTGMPNDYGEVMAACRLAAENRFHLAVGFGIAAGVVAAFATIAILACWLSSRRASVEEKYRLRHRDA